MKEAHGLTEVQQAYNVAQSELYQLAAYGHCTYTNGEMLTEEGRRMQRDYGDRIQKAREMLETALLRLVAEHAEKTNSPFVSVDWLQRMASDPAALSLLAVHPDDLGDSPSPAAPSVPADADRAASPFVPPAADCLPLAALDSATDGASALDAWARDSHGRNFLAHALVQLARDGWLRTEPGEGFEPVRDREALEPEDPAELRRMADEGQQAVRPTPGGYEETTGHAITCGAGFGMGCQCDDETQQAEAGEA